MQDSATLGVVIAFTAGILSFLSPCVLPLVPSYVTFVTGLSLEDLSRARRVALVHSLLFVCGFTAIFVALGAGATALGVLLAAYREWISRIGGVLLVVFGLIGVAWGTVIPALVTNLLVVPLYTLRVLEMRPRDYLVNGYVRPMLCALPVAVMAYGFSTAGEVSWSRFAAEAAAMCGVVAIMSYFLCLYAEQRAAVEEVVARLVDAQDDLVLAFGPRVQVLALGQSGLEPGGDQRRHDHEDDQQHQHDVDHWRHVDVRLNGGRAG